VWLLVVPGATLFLAYRAYVSYREKNQSLEFLHRATHLMSESPQVETALLALLDQARTMFRAEQAEICLVAASPAARHDAALRTVLGPNDAFEVMEPVTFDAPAPDAPNVLQPDSMVVMLKAEMKVLGTMTLTSRLGDVTSFDERDLKLFHTLANHVSVWLVNSRLEQSLVQLTELQDQLRYQALHDPLTSLANRALFSDHVQHALRRTERTDRNVAVLFLDLDDFKGVNDRLGHQAGDRLLAEIARALVAAGRESDRVFRYGGDEFALILPGADSSSALSVAERVRAAVREIGRGGSTWADAALAISVSIGLATYPRDGATADDILLAADRACFVAKRTGQGLIATADEGLAIAADFAFKSPTPIDVAEPIRPSGDLTAASAAFDTASPPAA
jgi:diguanylate cyclase (GGDEF)-like protein